MSNKLSVKLIHTGSLSEADGSVGTGSTHIPPKLMEWYQGTDERDITIITNDLMLNREAVENIKGTKVAWLIEPEEINPQYQYIQSMKEYFDYILTHDYNYIDDKKVLFCPLAGHWVVDKQVYPKSKMLSVIASGKNNLEGHRLRHQVIRNPELTPFFDGIFGRGYNPIENKVDGLRDYRYHLVIENVRKNCWFTEKLIDAFVTGCLPIYWGAPTIDNHFDERGMIIVDNERNCATAIKEHLTPSYYNACLPYIKKNFGIAMNKYLTPEDYMVKNIFGV